VGGKMRNRKRAGQRFYSDTMRKRALELAAAGNSPADVARRLGVNRSTVRSWLYRARHAPTGPSLGPAAREALADQASRELAAAHDAIRGGDPAAILAATRRVSVTLERVNMADGRVAPEVAARLTVDPWTGEPIHRARVPR
jgi:transposase